MKLMFFVIILAAVFSAFAQDEALMQDAITKPALSLRCKELFKERTDKIQVQQKLNALLQRNVSLLKKTPEQKASLEARLKSNQVRVKNELHLANMQIESMEEKIIRSGCPGLSLNN